MLDKLPYSLEQASLLVEKGVRAVSFDIYDADVVSDNDVEFRGQLRAFKKGNMIGFILPRGREVLVGYAVNKTMLDLLEGVIALEDIGSPSAMVDSVIGLLLGYSPDDIHMYVTR